MYDALACARSQASVCACEDDGQHSMRGQCAWPQKGEHVRDVVRLAEIDTGVAHGCSGRRHLHSRTRKSQPLASAMISNDRSRFCGSKMSETDRKSTRLNSSH